MPLLCVSKVRPCLRAQSEMILVIMYMHDTRDRYKLTESGR